eukprot:1140658-Pelagomonas_calceolata.AAC.1
MQLRVGREGSELCSAASRSEKGSQMQSRSAAEQQTSCRSHFKKCQTMQSVSCRANDRAINHSATRCPQSTTKFEKQAQHTCSRATQQEAPQIGRDNACVPLDG